MAYSAKILLDSMAPSGSRLVTYEITIPRIVLSEFNTHRLFSRNSASSRAIPVKIQIEKVLNDPFIPVYWGKNQKGMQANEELSESQQFLAKELWIKSRNSAIDYANALLELGVHKQITNRILEPWMWQTIIISATDYENFFAQRCSPEAQPEIRVIAEIMRNLYYSNKPKELLAGDWHLPLIDKKDERAVVKVFWERDYPDEEDVEVYLKKISVARCARVSYLNHLGKRDIIEDLNLFDRLAQGSHMSPMEHIAMALSSEMAQIEKGNSNFFGWHQYRKDFPQERRSYSWQTSKE